MPTAKNMGWAGVGISHDSGEFAAESIRRWWHHIGRRRFLNAGRLTVTADGGSWNGTSVRLWKTEQQKLAREVRD